MCSLSSTILHIRAEQDLDNDAIAKRMGPLLKRPLTGSAVGKYFSSQGAGVPLDSIEAFLGAFGLKAVANDTVCIPKKKYNAMLVFLKDGVNAMEGE